MWDSGPTHFYCRFCWSTRNVSRSVRLLCNDSHVQLHCLLTGWFSGGGLLSLWFQQHPDAKVGICPYNASHVLPIRLFVAHVNGCPDMRLVDPDQDQDKGDWITKPHMFRCMKMPWTGTAQQLLFLFILACIGGGVTMEEITKFWFEIPFCYWTSAFCASRSAFV